MVMKVVPTPCPGLPKKQNGPNWPKRIENGKIENVKKHTSNIEKNDRKRTKTIQNDHASIQDRLDF